MPISPTVTDKRWFRPPTDGLQVQYESAVEVVAESNTTVEATFQLQETSPVTLERGRSCGTGLPA